LILLDSKAFERKKDAWEPIPRKIQMLSETLKTVSKRITRPLGGHLKFQISNELRERGGNLKFQISNLKCIGRRGPSRISDFKSQMGINDKIWKWRSFLS